jgi:HD superfamily phosphodiesterase
MNMIKDILRDQAIVRAIGELDASLVPHSALLHDLTVTCEADHKIIAAVKEAKRILEEAIGL